MIVWISFLTLIFIFLALDLGVFNKNPHVISTKEASKWTAIWFTLSMLFSGVVYWLYSTDFVSNPDGLKPAVASMKFITGYLIELSLSIDNIFVIALIFGRMPAPSSVYVGPPKGAGKVKLYLRFCGADPRALAAMA